MTSIQVKVAIHDRSQIEATFDYDPFAPGDEAGKGQLRYTVEAYFIPQPGLPIDADAYPKESFFRDLRALLRFRAPKLKYRELLGEKPDTPSPYAFVKRFCDELAAGSIVAPPSAVISQARMFASVFYGYVNRRIGKQATTFARAVEDPAALAAFISGVYESLEKSAELLRRWRDLDQHSRSFPSGLMEQLAQEIHLVSEYCSYVYRDAVLRLLVRLQDDRRPEIAALVRKMTAYLRLERRLARKFGLYWLDLASSEQEQEQYVLRRGLLKKSVQRVLYLDLRTQPLFRMQRHLGAMVAAALAAAWAVGAQIVIWTQLSFQGYAELRSFLGLGGFLAITALVMAYVLKDRIKEVGRNYFRSRIFREIPDSNERITYTGRHGAVELGNVREFVHIVPSKRLPDEILAVARRHGLANDDQQVIHYRKLITLTGPVLRGMRGISRGIHDVLRYDISSFLPRLDEPLASHRVLAANGIVHEVLMPKVYSMDMALRYSHLVPREDTHMQYVRLYFDKAGLKRCEVLG